MLTAILLATPKWVWALLAGLIALGVSQSLSRSMTLRRATIVPAVLVVLSAYGVMSTFGAQASAILAWAAGLAVAVGAASAAGAWRGIAWSSREQRLKVPGSWWPMALIMALFIIKYGVGVTLAMQPRLMHEPMFASLVALAYGGFSGMFLSRAVAMWKAARGGLRLAGTAAA
jgi:hypothetical protein